MRATTVHSCTLVLLLVAATSALAPQAGSTIPGGNADGSELLALLRLHSQQEQRERRLLATGGQASGQRTAGSASAGMLGANRHIAQVERSPAGSGEGKVYAAVDHAGNVLTYPSGREQYCVCT